jgi:colicin import membrane protein
MSKELAFNENANVAWDLHEKNEIVPLEFTEENNVELFGTDPTKAKEMVSGLSTTLSEREVLKNAYIDVIGLEINTENLPIFKELRLKIMKNRTQGLTKWKEKEKSFYLAGGNFIQAVYNKEVAVNEEMESKLLEAEKFFENQEKEKARLLNESRIERIKEYVEDVTGLDFSPMTDEDFDDYLLGKKTRFENAKKEAQEKAEAEILENRKKETFQKRQLEIAPYVQFLSENNDLKEMPERLYQDMLFSCKKSKLEFEEKVKLQEIENAKLKAEADEKEKALEKERVEAKAKQDAIELKAKQEREKSEAEIKRLNDEKARFEKEANDKLESDRLEANKLAKAPVKKQLSVWVDSFELPNTEVNNEISKEIIANFEAFKKWSLTQINNL